MALGSAVGSPALTTPAGVVTTEPPRAKVAFPNTFNGDRKKLKSFFIQTELWLLINKRHFLNDMEKVV
jgi:hypothetical protein